MKRLLVVGVILLFLGSSIPVLAQSNENSQVIQTRKTTYPVNTTVSMYVIESKADGSIEKTTITLSADKNNQLQERLKSIQDPEARFSIYQEFGIIPKDASIEKYRLGMEFKAKQLGYNSTEPSSRLIPGNTIWIKKWMFCFVDIKAEFIFFPIRKFFTSLIPFPIPSVNLLIWFADPYLRVRGENYDFLAMQTFGFVGITVGYMLPGAYPGGSESWGFSVMCVGEFGR
jgi:hypothetical protein